MKLNLILNAIKLGYCVIVAYEVDAVSVEVRSFACRVSSVKEKDGI